MGNISVPEKLKIFLASPSDVVKERQHVIKAVEEVNRTVAAEQNAVLDVVSWTDASFPGYGGDPQALINEQIAEMSR